MGKQKYVSDIVLGEKYLDEQTGYEGTAVAVYFFQFACERVALEAYDPITKKVIETTFDAPRLKNANTGVWATVEKTGGPSRAGEGSRPMGSVR